MKELEFQIYQCVNPECRFRCPNDLSHRTMEHCPVCGADFLPSGQPFSNFRGNSNILGTPGKHIEVVLDNLRSTLNVGSIFRSADGAGVRHIHCCGTTPTPKHPKIEKSGLGAEDFIGWTYHRNTLHLILSLKQQGFIIICLEATEKSTPLAEINKAHPKEKIALVLGNEVSGIDPAVLEAADHVISIPMLGRKTSLNVAVAFGIAIYALVIKQNWDNIGNHQPVEESMPTYEYKCQDCGAQFEALRSMRDSDLPIVCKECNSSNTIRKLSVCYVSGGSDNSGSHAGHSGCGGCQGGSCSSCGH